MGGLQYFKPCLKRGLPPAISCNLRNPSVVARSTSLTRQNTAVVSHCIPVCLLQVVGAGAGVAAAVIDKVSTAAGNVVANSSMVANSRGAPEGSMRRETHDMLVAGAVAVGRVWEAVDGQGKVLLESTGDGVGRIAGAKYGSEAEHAARSVGQIGLDGWRIFRFPTKLGVTTLVKGAVRGTTAAGSQSSSTSNVGQFAAQPTPPNPSSS